MLYDRKQDLPATSICMLAAADYIREHGWCQRVTSNYRGQVCLVGGLMGGSNASPSIVSKALLILDNKLGKSAVVWNDTRGRAVEEIISLLETTAWEALDDPH